MQEAGESQGRFGALRVPFPDAMKADIPGGREAPNCSSRIREAADWDTPAPCSTASWHNLPARLRPTIQPHRTPALAPPPAAQLSPTPEGSTTATPATLRTRISLNNHACARARIHAGAQFVVAR